MLFAGHLRGDHQALLGTLPDGGGVPGRDRRVHGGRGPDSLRGRGVRGGGQPGLQPRLHPLSVQSGPVGVAEAGFRRADQQLFLLLSRLQPDLPGDLPQAVERGGGFEPREHPLGLQSAAHLPDGPGEGRGNPGGRFKRLQAAFAAPVQHAGRHAQLF